MENYQAKYDVCIENNVFVCTQPEICCYLGDIESISRCIHCLLRLDDNKSAVSCQQA